ncbi:MAG: lytic transglycosylase domain-containing protein [Pseudomonadota bacterium]|nr:lytic transglycosylase domain-containing protein [Pseudomonadota bacterium]
MRFTGPGLLVLSVSLGLCLGTAEAARPPLPPENPFRSVQVDPPARHAGELSDADWRAWQTAFAAASARRFDAAFAKAAETRDRRLMPVLDWLRILNGDDATPEEIERFLARHAEFPQRNTLLVRLESAVLATDDKDRIRRFLSDRPALTGAGMLAQALLLRNERADRALELARRVWRTRDITAADEHRLLQTFGGLLTPEDHRVRLDRLVWDGQRTAAERMKDVVGRDLWRLADARLRLRYRSAGVDAAIEAVPASLQNDEGLLYERALWRRKAGRDEGVREIILGFDGPSAEPSRWWVERRIQVRELIALGRIEDAYRIASRHGLGAGADFAEAEFQSGWIALRFLGRTDLALDHFQRLHDNVSYPVSLSRGAYWVARALDAAGRNTEARDWYARAARHGMTYYGQLARTRLGETAFSLPAEARIPAASRAAFAAEPVVQMIRLLVEIDELRLARLFVTWLGQSATDTTRQHLVGDLAVSLDTPHLQVLAGKLAALDDTLMPSIAYPVMRQLTDNGRIEPALAHAITRQESAFDPTAVSHAGARGLMQLMPATAKAVAGWEQIGFEPRRLTEDPAYNARLGSAYLGRQIADFDGYLPMAIAAYNAGPHRVGRWITQYGDPRSGQVDPVDWIELIPFSETRNYVQRVLEALQVYRLRLSGQNAGQLGLLADLGMDGGDRGRGACMTAALLRLPTETGVATRSC